MQKFGASLAVAALATIIPLSAFGATSTTNLVANPGYDSGLTSWGKDSSGSTLAVASSAGSSGAGVNVTASSAGTLGVKQTLSAKSVAGSAYNVSAYLKAGSKSTLDGSVVVTETRSNGTKLAAAVSTPVTLNSTSFTKVSFSYTAQYSDSTLTVAARAANATKGEVLTVDDWAATPQIANALPTASFTSSVTGLSAAFDGSGSSDTDGSIATYAWNFGDGATATGKTTNHTYTTAGTYNVTLTVTDNSGASTTLTKNATATKPNAAPTAVFTSTVTDLTAAFDGSGSSDTDGSIATYAWNFGDGATATGKTTNHTYTTAGTYNVTLTVTDNSGAQSTTNRAATVTKTATTGSVPGWNLSYSTTFSDLTGWTVYNNQTQNNDNSVNLSKNVTAGAGGLKIAGIKESGYSMPYTSGEIVGQSSKLIVPNYFRAEVTGTFEDMTGVWPCLLWFRPQSGGDGSNGEIDVMEWMGGLWSGTQKRVAVTMHNEYGATHDAIKKPLILSSNTWFDPAQPHTYTMEKVPGSISVWIDGHLVGKFTAADKSWWDRIMEAPDRTWYPRITLQLGSGSVTQTVPNPDSYFTRTEMGVTSYKVWTMA